MKKTCLLLLCVLLLLTACGGRTAPAETAAAGESSAPSTAEEGNTLSSTPAPEDSKAPSGEDPAPGLVFSGSVTAGGVLVYTDPGAYQPDPGSKAVYTRLREGELREFVPSPDYGAVYPYAAVSLYVPNQYYDMEPGEPCFWRTGTLYGFVDRNGRILTDGLYQEFDDYAYDYASGYWVEMPLWIAHRVINSEEHKDAYDGFVAWWDGGSDEYFVIAKDGRFSLGPFLKAEGFPGGFIAWDYDRKPTVYNENGEPLFDGDRLLEQGIRDCLHVEYGEGLYLIDYYPVDSDRWYTNAEYCICDSTGTIRFGPYEYAGAFHDGLACVKGAEDQDYRFIDHDGETVIDHLAGAGDFQDGLAYIIISDEERLLIDRTGKVLRRFTEWGSFETAPCGFVYSEQSWDHSNTILFDPEGRVLCEDCDCLDEDTFCETLEDGSRIFHLNGEELVLPGMTGLKPWTYWLDGEPVKGYLGFRDEDRKPWFVPADLSEPVPCLELGEGETLRAPRNAYYGIAFIRTDQTNGENWYCMWDGKQWRCLSDAGRSCSLPDGVRYVYAAAGRLLFYTEEESCLIDADGEVVFRYPLDAQD